MEHTLAAYGIAAIAGFFAAAINAVAGGGTLVSFPVLMWLGLPSRVANATNAVALWPGSITGALGMHRYFQETKSELLALIAPTVVGAAVGSCLLIATPQRSFDLVVPALILIAATLLAAQKRIKAWAEKRSFQLSPAQVAILQFMVAIYGGYFGAGMGIMMLAVMSLYRGLDLHRLNVIKNWLAVVINFAAGAVLLGRGLADMPLALAVMVGALLGGYVSGRISQRFDADRLRLAVVAYGYVMVGVMIWRIWK